MSKTTKALNLRTVSVNELETVMGFYRSYIGTPGCTWNEYYPNDLIMQQDFESGNLYGLYMGCELIGAISVSAENHMDDLPCWENRENVKEIARVVISPAHQGQKHGTTLLKILFEQLRNQGTEAIHLLVSPDNHKALSLYDKFQFKNRGKFFLYEHDYLALEAKI